MSLIMHHRWGDFVGNHMAGLGVVGLLASQAGHIARKKGRAFTSAFLVGVLLPLSLGAAAALLVTIMIGFVYCGGGVVLATAVIVPIAYCCLRQQRVTASQGGAAASANIAAGSSLRRFRSRGCRFRRERKR